MSYYRQQKPSKAETPPKSLITTIWPHTKPYEILPRTIETVAMIDPGTRNYCIRVEERNLNGRMAPKLYAKWDLAEADPSGEEVDITMAVLTRRLNGYKDLFLTVDRVLIERQLPINYNSTLVMQHTRSYFEILLADLPSLPTIHLVDPKLKSRILAKRMKMTKPELKAWSPGEAAKWLLLQNDKWSLSILEEAKKKDDLADVVVMREAYYRYMKSDFATPDVMAQPKIHFVIKDE